MKKIISLVIVLTLCLSLCACSGDPLEKAIEEADALVSKWHNEGYGGCIYKGEYIKEKDGFAVSMYIVYARYPATVDALEVGAGFVKNTMTRTMLDELYPQLVNVFDGLDVSIAFILSDQNGKNTYSTILDGEVEYYK